MWLEFYQNKLANISEFFSRLSLKELIDILIITFFIYFVLLFIKKTKLTYIILGILILFLIYEASVNFDFPLTKTLLRPFAEIFLIILVIIFQKELRRFLSAIGVFGFKKTILPPTEQTIKTIIRTLEYFVKHRIGALIVFPGQESLERHLEGGVTLNGEISFPLLLSIFDESSPGHDGAIIIEGNLVKKFAVHLPLAENIEVVKKFGTRHRAGLGLAEVSDALVVIVSQEKGNVSIAYNKNLTSYNNIEEVKKIIYQFLEEKFPKRKIKIYKKVLRENLKLILMSLLISFLFWLLLFPQVAFVQKQFIVPIQFKNLPSGYIISKFSPTEIKVTFSGRESDFKLVDPQELKITLSIPEPKIGWQNLKIEKDNINSPPEISPVKIGAESVEVLISKTP